VPAEYNIEELHPSVKSAWENVLETIQFQGHKILPISLPSTKHALSAYYILAAAEAASNLAKYDGIRYGTRGEGDDGPGGVLYSETRGNGFGDEVKRRILLGSYTLSSEAINNYFIQAQRVRRLVQNDFDRVFKMPNVLRPSQQFDLSDLGEDIQLEDKLGPSQVDLIVCPTAPTLPPLLRDINEQTPVDAYVNDVFTVPSSLAGLPSISVPWDIPKDQRLEDNVPFAGVQVIGQYWDDFLVIRFGQVLQSLSGSLERGMRNAIPI
jgi:aspartyl-tRNA(Asn)/glutamyl-tRNA(Gln) amidotransferase subunit A